MGAIVQAILSARHRLGIERSSPFSGLSDLISAFAPLRVDAAFIRSGAAGSVLDLAVEFSDEAAYTGLLLKDSLLRAEAMLDFEVTFPRDRFLSLKADWTCLRIVPSTMQLPSGKVVAFSLPVVNVVTQVFQQADSLQSRIAYCAELTRVDASIESARQLIPALADLRTGGRQITGLVEALTDTFSMLKAGGWSAFERIYVGRENAARDARWIETILRSHFRENLSFLDEDLLAFKWEEVLEPPKALTLQERVSRIRREGYLKEVFDTLVPLPEKSRARMLSACLEGAKHTPQKLDSGNYVFISYSHRDVALVKPLLATLEEMGINYWFDSDILAGAKWDEDLELKIRNSGALLAFVSDEYQGSKYCRRELKFADLIGKPILPVAATPWAWSPGLQMMFQELHVIALDQDPAYQKLRSALTSAAPQTFVALEAQTGMEGQPTHQHPRIPYN